MAARMLLGLLVSLLFVSSVASLRCYVCNSSPTNQQCNNQTQECPAPLDTCMTIVVTLGPSKAIVKQCSSQEICSGAAASATIDSDGNGSVVTCCSAFSLCNFSGAESLRARAPPLLLSAVATLLLLLRP